MRREGTKNIQYVRRIPADLRERAVGLRLAVPVGPHVQQITVTNRMPFVRLSLRTDAPAEVKARTAAIDAYLENVWRALRAKAPVSLSHKQATALAGTLYRAWAGSSAESRERTMSIEYLPDGSVELSDSTHMDPDEWAVVAEQWKAVAGKGDRDTLEQALGPIIDRLLLAKGIAKVDAPTRGILLTAFATALRDAFDARTRNAAGDYRPDSNSERFPEWTPPPVNGAQPARALGPKAARSLDAIFDGWWTEAKARGVKPATHERRRGTMTVFIQFLGHDDSSRVTPEDVIRFKDHRLATINPRTGRLIDPRTIQDAELSCLRSIFKWAVENGRMRFNPAQGISIKPGKKRRMRTKDFKAAEAKAILEATLELKRGKESAKTFAAKRWVPWLMAYTGARVGEFAQLRKEDVRKEGRHWIATVSPEAGTVKTNEARDVVLHPHLAELGFPQFVKSAAKGHLFLTPSKEDGDVLGPLQAVKNRLAEFVRTIVPDPNVAPNHGWRHTFKTRARDVGIDKSVRDAIQGHKPTDTADEYGHVSIEAQAKALAKLPRYRVRRA